MKYVAYYDTLENQGEARDVFPSARAKIDYIVDVLNRVGHSVELISASHARVARRCSGRLAHVRPGVSLRLFASLPWGGKARRILSILYTRISAFAWLMTHVHKGETVIVYHSLGYVRWIYLLRTLKRCRLILEVEELYSDVTGVRSHRRLERRLFAVADGFIFPTELLGAAVEPGRRPYIVIHGTYSIEPLMAREWDDDRIHVVYSGTLDPRKGGLAAAAAARYLDERFHIHILGFGRPDDEAALVSAVHEMQSVGGCGLTYDGLLTGEEYSRFLQSCDIGLSTQRLDAEFNDTSFPSKVLMYLVNGLRVVTVKLRALECSAVGDLMYYCESDTPEAIAAAIQAVDLSCPYDSRARIAELDQALLSPFRGMFSECVK